MKYVTYVGPGDAFDARQLLGKPDDTDLVFHRPNTDDLTVPADLRGNIVAVTDKMAEELFTYPNHNFVEVPEEQAKTWIEVQKQAQAVRLERERLYAQHNPVAPAPTLAQVHPALSLITGHTVEVAPMAPRDPKEVQAEVREELKALKAQEKQEKAAKE